MSRMSRATASFFLFSTGAVAKQNLKERKCGINAVCSASSRGTEREKDVEKVGREGERGRGGEGKGKGKGRRESGTREDKTTGNWEEAR